MVEARAHVALLVDFANLRQQFDVAAEGTGAPPGRELAQALMRYAAGAGRVTLARAYADWSREPELSRALSGTGLSPVLVPASEDGEDRSHIRLCVDALEVLYNGDEPDAFVLVSSDASLVPLVQAVRGDGKEILLVASEAAVGAEMRVEADQFVSLEDVLAGEVAEPVEPRPWRGAGAESAREGGGRGRREARERDRPTRPLLTEPVFDDYDWSEFVRLIDELEQRLPFVGVRYLVNKVLAPHNCGIDDPRIKRDLMNAAVDEGLIEMYTVGNVGQRSDPVTACRLDRENEIVVAVLGPGTAAPAIAEDGELTYGEPADDWTRAPAR